MDELGLWKTLQENERLALHAALYTWPARQIQPGWVLDLGSEYGVGSLLIAQSNPGLQVLSADVDRAALRYSREMAATGRVARVESNALGLPLARASLTGIYIINLLHLLHEPGDALREAWRVLRPGGLAVVSVPRGSLAGDEHNGARLIEQIRSILEEQFSSSDFPEEICGRSGRFPARQFR